MLNLSSRLRTKFSKSNSITPLIIVWAKQPKKLPSTIQRKWTGLNTPWSTIKKLLVLLCLATTNTAPRCGTVWWLTVHSTSTVPPLSRNRRWSILFSSDTTTYWEQDGDRLFKLEMTWFHGLAQATISSWQATARRTNFGIARATLYSSRSTVLTTTRSKPSLATYADSSLTETSKGC